MPNSTGSAVKWIDTAPPLPKPPSGSPSVSKRATAKLLPEPVKALPATTIMPSAGWIATAVALQLLLIRNVTLPSVSKSMSGLPSVL